MLRKARSLFPRNGQKKMLPELPKQNKKPEADFGLDFRNKWWNKVNRRTEPYELKDTRGENSLPFSELSDDQIKIGLAAKSNKGVLIRIMNGTPGSPDYMGLRNSPYWIVIKFPRSAEVIDIETFLLEKNRSKRKSLTWEKAKSISTISIKT